MKRLYTPFKVNKLELKNRVIMSPMSIGHTVDGFIMDDVVEFYKRRAQGGVGLIIFANMQWDKLRYNPNHGAMLTDEKYIPSLKKLTDAIHEGGSKVFAQLMHRGRCANRASIQGEQAVAPSPIPGRFTHFEMPKELTVEEIKEFVDWQAEAAVIAKKAGFDGIEIETNSGYLYGQFFSPLTNHRTDEYGGSLENRCRFMVETLEGMRAAVGPDYPISLRVSGSDFMDGGCNGDDIAEICELLDKTGYVDGFSITAGWHESAVPLITMEVPHGAWAYLGRQIKARVKAPVAQGMRMNIEKAEELVDRGDFDAIVMGRPFLADPDVVNKAEAGKASTIRPCVGCNAKCLDMAMVSKPIGCIGNYECNREEELEDENGLMPTEKKSEHPEKILVIGAGPSGMEFARVAALRGHKVTIWEKRNRTIGLSLYAATPPRRYDIRYFGQWLERTCRELGVEIILNKEATAEDIIAASKDYDRVVLACGSKASIPPIPRDPSVPIVHAWDVFEGTAELGKNVVVVGGGDVGVEVAMYIGEIGTLTADELRFMMIYPNIEYLIVDQETGTEVVEDGQPGEIICRGECVMHEYWNNPEETAKMLRNGWLYTGDIGRIDEEGFLIICDRKKDLIITGGFNVFPSELEAVAITAENVADAIAIGVPNERRGEVPAIFVQPIAGKTVDLNEVERVCREKLSRFKVPKEYYIMDMLPKTKNRKPDRKMVKKLYLEHAFDDQKKEQ